MLDVSILVCTYNRERYLPKCLKGLAEQDYHVDKYEIIVIDNNSSDSTASIVSEFQKKHDKLNCRYFLETQQGLSFARNRGIKESKAPIVAFIDDDAIAEPDWLRFLLIPFNNPQVVGVGGKTELQFLAPCPDWINKKWYLEYQPSVGEPFPASDGKWPIGVNMALRKEALKDMEEPFNTSLGRKGELLLAGEETDLFRRLSKAGGLIMIQPRAMVQHLIPPERLTKQYFMRTNFGHGITKVTKQLTKNPRKRLFLQINAICEVIISYLLYLLAIITFNSRQSIMRRYFKYYRYLGKLAALNILPRFLRKGV